MVIALIAAAEALLFSASGAKRCQARRQQVLMGSPNLGRSLPLLDDYLKRKTAGASRIQQFVAAKLAHVCRQVVITRSFEFLLLHFIRTAILKRRSNIFTSHGRVTL